MDCELQTAALVIETLLQLVHQNPSALQPYSLRPADLNRLRANIEPTFLIRLYAEFESGLRDAWRTAFGRPTHPRMYELLESVAARQLIPETWLREAHEVREYRNSLVHEAPEGEEQAVEPITLSEARQRLVRFFSRLPADW